MTEQEFYKTLGDKLKTIRKTTDIKQTELAEKMGVNKSFVGLIESQGEKTSAYRINQMLENMGKPSLLDLIDRVISEPEKKTSKLTLHANLA